MNRWQIINGRWTSTNETDAFDSNRVKMEKYCKEEDTRAVHARKQSDPLVSIRIYFFFYLIKNIPAKKSVER